jgi:O-acetylhomoserine/O-acetylserine sulfhydrylase-like pyridoxal-dependent enzyme
MKNFNAIRFLYPDAIFSMIDDDVKQITWVGQEYPVPTSKALKDAIAAMEAAEAKAIADKAAAKASAIAKLEALGLNLEEAQAIFG